MRPNDCRTIILDEIDHLLSVPDGELNLCKFFECRARQTRAFSSRSLLRSSLNKLKLRNPYHIEIRTVRCGVKERRGDARREITGRCMLVRSRTVTLRNWEIPLTCARRSPCDFSTARARGDPADLRGDPADLRAEIPLPARGDPADLRAEIPLTARKPSHPPHGRRRSTQKNGQQVRCCRRGRFDHRSPFFNVYRPKTATKECPAAVLWKNAEESSGQLGAGREEWRLSWRGEDYRAGERLLCGRSR